VTSVAPFHNYDFIYKRNGYQDHGIYRTVDNEFLFCVLYKFKVNLKDEVLYRGNQKEERRGIN
jgi:hypothetical protein